MQVRDVLQRLTGVKKTGERSWAACCPAHDDRSPSLTVSVGSEGRVLLHCHAGCETAAILDATGLKTKDIMPDQSDMASGPNRAKHRPTRPDQDEYYVYTDEQGAPLFRVVRTPAKRFFQQRFEGHGTFKPGITGVRRVLYRLPAVLEAISRNETIYLAEGEKDVHTMEQMGFVATTNPGGAGKWHDDYSRALEGADVVILPDNDDPGRDHARKIASHLIETTRSVRIADLPGLPVKGDVTDYFREGRSREDFLAFVSVIPPLKRGISPSRKDSVTASRHSIYKSDVDRVTTGDGASVRGVGVKPSTHGDSTHGDDSAPRSAMDSQAGATPSRVTPLWGFERPPERTWFVEGFIPDGYVTIMAADGGTGKSFLALYLSVCVAIGMDFFGLPTTAGRVLYVDFELDETEQKRRLWSVLRGLDMTPDDERLRDKLYYHRGTGSLTKEETQEEIVSIIHEREISLTVLDSLTIASAGADATSQSDVTPVMQAFSRWGTVLAIDHMSRTGSRGDMSKASAYGSVFKRNHARSTVNLARAEGGGLILVADKNNFGPRRDLLAYAMDFREDAVQFRPLRFDADELVGALQNMPPLDVTLRAVTEIVAERGRAASYDDIFAWRKEHEITAARGTIKNHCTALKGQKRITYEGGGRVMPVGAAVEQMQRRSGPKPLNRYHYPETQDEYPF